MQKNYGWMWVFKMLKARRVQILGVFALSVLEFIPTLLLPLFTSAAIDGHSYDWIGIYALGGITLTALLLAPIVSQKNIALTTGLGKFLELRVQKKLFIQILKHDTDGHEMSSADILNISEKAKAIGNFSMGAAPGFLLSVVVSFASFILMIYYDVLIALTVAAISTIASFTVMKQRSKIVDEVTRLYAKKAMGQKILSHLSYSLKKIKAQALETHFYNQWSSAVTAYATANVLVSVRANHANITMQLASRLSIFIIVIIGIFQVESGGLTVGDIVALTILATNLSSPFVAVSGLNRQFQEANVALKDLTVLFNTPRHITNRGRLIIEGQAHFELNDLAARYGGLGSTVIEGLNFSFPPKGVIVILGKNGSGKSTLLNILQGIKRDYTGDVLLNGHDLKVYHAGKLNCAISKVDQDPFLFSDTIEGYITAGITASPDIDRLDEALSFSDATEFVASQAMGLQEPLREGGANFSGGQRQRLAIARAVYKNPEIVFFDEPTSSLDVDAALALERNIAGWAKDRLVFLVTHNLYSAKIADLIVLLDEGKILAHGTHDELTKTTPHYVRLWETFTREEARPNPK